MEEIRSDSYLFAPLLIMGCFGWFIGEYTFTYRWHRKQSVVFHGDGASFLLGRRKDFPLDCDNFRCG